MTRLLHACLTAFQSSFVRMTPASNRELVVAQIAPSSGLVGAAGAMFTAGAAMCFDESNRTGGIRGRRIRHVTLDDGYDCARSAQMARELLDAADLPVAILSFGTDNTLAVSAELAARGLQIPTLPSGSGSSSLRTPFDRNLFHIRASYASEMARLVQTLAKTSVRSMVLVCQDDEFGRDTEATLRAHVAGTGLSLVRTIAHPRSQQDIAPMVAWMRDSEAHVVLLATTAQAATSFIRQAHRLDYRPVIATLSDMDPHTLVEEAGDAAKTVMLSQTVPDPHCTDIPLVAEFSRLAAASAGEVPCHVQALEGFMQARVVVEGLKRAERPDAGGLLKALEAIHDLDLGGYRLSFSDGSHEGCAAVRMAVVAPSGRLIHHT